jgi:hypothetical protein
MANDRGGLIVIGLRDEGDVATGTRRCATSSA